MHCRTSCGLQLERCYLEWTCGPHTLPSRSQSSSRCNGAAADASPLGVSTKCRSTPGRRAVHHGEQGRTRGGDKETHRRAKAIEAKRTKITSKNNSLNFISFPLLLKSFHFKSPSFHVIQTLKSSSRLRIRVLCRTSGACWGHRSLLAEPLRLGLERSAAAARLSSW